MWKWLKSWWSRILAASGRRSGTVAAPPSASKRELFGQIRKVLKPKGGEPAHGTPALTVSPAPAAAPTPAEPALALDWNPRAAPASDVAVAPPLADSTPDTGPILGIDLGTTHAVAAVVRGGKVEIIPNQEGENLTPSVVAFTADGGVLVGRPALRQAALNPGRTVYSIKRCLGRDSTARATAYEIVAGPDGSVRVRVDGRSYTPEEISALILGKLLDAARAHLGHPIRRAVLTVPASFDDAQRQATLDAALLAGLDVQWVLENPATRCKVLQPMRIITEPTAAALAYGLHQLNRKLAVLHLGGGTFDVSLLDTGGGVVTVQASNGDAALGGDDFDQVLIDHFAASLADRLGLDPRRDPVALSRLKEAAEQAKKDLSQSDEVRVRVPHLVRGAIGPLHLDVSVTRAEFEQLAAPLLERCRTLVLQSLRDVGYRPGDVDEVLLIGGMTRMPRLRALVREIFGRDASSRLNPDEAVAMGAAVQGAQLQLGGGSDLLLIDVAPLTLGLAAKGGAFVAMVRRNTTIPSAVRRTATTVRDHQPGVSVRIFQGEDAIVVRNRFLAQLDFADLPLGPRGQALVDVSFDIDQNGILTVSATERVSGRSKTLRVAPGKQLTTLRAKQLRQDAKCNTADRPPQALTDARHRADLWVNQLEKMARDAANRLAPAQLAPLRSLGEQLRQAAQGTDTAAIHDAANALEPALQALAAWLKGHPTAPGGQDAFEGTNLEI